MGRAPFFFAQKKMQTPMESASFYVYFVLPQEKFSVREVFQSEVVRSTTKLQNILTHLIYFMILYSFICPGASQSPPMHSSSVSP